jgi:hypothetical protein
MIHDILYTIYYIPNIESRSPCPDQALVDVGAGLHCGTICSLQDNGDRSLYLLYLPVFPSPFSTLHAHLDRGIGLCDCGQTPHLHTKLGGVILIGRAAATANGKARAINLLHRDGIFVDLLHFTLTATSLYLFTFCRICRIGRIAARSKSAVPTIDLNPRTMSYPRAQASR